MRSGFFSRLWQRDRVALAIAAVGSVMATILWRGTTRPMADTSGYRSAAVLLLHGWPRLPDRTPGYPLLLVLTGSSHQSTHLLFAVQLAMHLAAVVMVVDVARRVGVGWRGRAALTALLMVPPVMLRVVYEGTEGLSALLLTAVFWFLASEHDEVGRTRRSLTLGILCGAAALTRPTFALVVVPVAMISAGLARGGAARKRWSRATALKVAAPAIVTVLALSAYNAAKFDSPGLTPLLPYHLSSRTSPYVENLPLSYEPARSVLIRERDRALLRGESMAPANFIWMARPELSRVTGLTGRALERYVLGMDIELILHNPFSYLDTVKTATVNYSNLDSQPAILGLSRPVAQFEEAIHLLLLASFLLVMGMVPGLALAGQVSRARLLVSGIGLVLSGYTYVVSVMVETGTARLRAPSEPIMACLLVVASAIVHEAIQRRRRSAP